MVDLEHSIILPAKALENAVKRIPSARESRGLSVLQNVAMVAGDSEETVGLATTDLESGSVSAVRKIEGTYPNWKQLIPKESDFVAQVAVNVSFLADFCAAAKQFAGPSGTAVLKLQANPCKPCVMTVDGGAPGYELTHLLMPVRADLKPSAVAQERDALAGLLARVLADPADTARRDEARDTLVKVMGEGFVGAFTVPSMPKQAA